MTIIVDVQYAMQDSNLPKESQFTKWAEAIPSSNQEKEVCLRIVDEEEGRSLNNKFRSINKATNVLAFPANLPDGIDSNFLGDIVICAPIVYQESIKQAKNLNSHYAHMLVHGVLHLLGYDHDNERNANEMENLEKNILNQLGFDNPY